MLTIGPNTRGGLIVAMVNLGLSFSKKSHAAFSAKVLLARYPFIGFVFASSNVIGFQSLSEYSCPGQSPLLASMMEANDEVMTTRLTEGADFLIDFKMPVVPMTAGSRRS